MKGYGLSVKAITNAVTKMEMEREGKHIWNFGSMLSPTLQCSLYPGDARELRIPTTVTDQQFQKQNTHSSLMKFVY